MLKMFRLWQEKQRTRRRKKMKEIRIKNNYVLISHKEYVITPHNSEDAPANWN